MVSATKPARSHPFAVEEEGVADVSCGVADASEVAEAAGDVAANCVRSTATVSTAAVMAAAGTRVGDWVKGRLQAASQAAANAIRVMRLKKRACIFIVLLLTGDTGRKINLLL